MTQKKDQEAGNRPAYGEVCWKVRPGNEEAAVTKVPRWDSCGCINSVAGGAG